MTSVDKAAIGWSMAIVAVGIGIAMVGLSADSDFAPSPAAPTTSDSKIQAAKQQIEMEQKLSQEEERAKAIAEQTGMMGEASVQIEETVEQEVELLAPAVEVPQATGPMSVDVSIPTGTSVPGCEDTNECWLPAEISVSVGDTVIWSNTDTAAHTVTSGSPTDGPDGIFDSSLFIAGATFEVTFDDSGSYDYFCMVHPWMQGNVQVN
ncbi:MAG: hypothetical protein IH814_00965 [Thaumarchaeota archaeon]|nr:hypothetical protein [Nitrososphaerota archaeon]